MQRNIIETLVGALVLAIAVGFAWFGFRLTGGNTRSGYEIAAQFERIDGISVGSDVRMSGIKVGTVTGAGLDPKTYFADLHLRLDDTIQVPEDSVAEITSDGLLGSRYLNLVPGNGDQVVKPGGRLRQTQAPVDLMALLGKYIFSQSGDSTKKDAPSGAAPPSVAPPSVAPPSVAPPSGSPSGAPSPSTGPTPSAAKP
jgi:phospholipid/cholesterol/gamma-HCH transport system substrate-binding protein